MRFVKDADDREQNTSNMHVCVRVYNFRVFGGVSYVYLVQGCPNFFFEGGQI